MPDYTMITNNPNDPLGYTPDLNQERQPTHVTEHVLYAIPGDAIALYPYYSFTNSTTYVDNYKVNFSHWYDYQSGGHLTFTDESSGTTSSLLDFLIDPSGITKTDKYGYIAGTELGNEFIEINSEEDYIDFVNKVNTYADYRSKSIKIMRDLDFAGRTVRPIGDGDGIIYTGTIEGNGNTIRNLKIDVSKNTDDKWKRAALVGKAGDGACVRNLTIDETCEFTACESVAAIFGQIDGSGQKQISNVQSYAKVIITNQNHSADNDVMAAAGLVGGHWSTSATVNIEDCYVGGSVASVPGNYGKTAAVIFWSPFDNCKGTINISNTVSVVTGTNDFAMVSNATTNITNCYGINYNELTGLTKIDAGENQNTEDFRSKLGDGWELGKNGISHIVPKVDVPFVVGENKFGSIATFFCPRSPYGEEGKLQNLPFHSGQHEFVIAGDFSQSFSRYHNIKDGQIIEPVIEFRHIFRIRDGKDFADEFSSSKEKNEEYIKKNLRRVSARAGVPFQIRLDSPIPMKGTTRSKYYYKISDSDYRRICTMNMKVIDLSTGITIQTLKINENGDMVTGEKDSEGKEIAILDKDGKPVDKSHFYYGESFAGQGSRSIEDITYNICGGGGNYYRMLKCEAPAAGRYLIRITGNDINANPIKICDNSGADLVVMEMEITFLPGNGGLLVSDVDLHTIDEYAFAREANLEAAYGKPRVYQNFDQYAALDQTGNDYFTQREYSYTENNVTYKAKEGYRFKWPMPWNDVTYAFDYNNMQDYNMYMLASHCSQTPYAAAAIKHKNINNTTLGLYDRLYYKTMRENNNDLSKAQYGYFYYVNAAADPGVSARLRLDEMCMGSTVHVSAWVAEFSNTSETANLSFNFTAVLNGDRSEVGFKGERRLLHSYISGYVPSDKCGQWMNIYYSFVPNYNEAGITPDDVDHFELELDNNCKNSGGADYAIDNIRIYVASPVVYATQNEPICSKPGETNKVTDVGVKVESPFDVLLQVVGETEATGDEQGKIVNLYYSFIDKEKFDAEYTGDNSNQAYVESVLHYNYSGTGGDNQTYGMVTFNTKFSSNGKYDEGNINVQNQAFQRTDKDGTQLIVFNTRPHDKQLEVGKEYYISLYLPPSSTPDVTPVSSNFDIKDPCSKVCVVRVKPTSVIKIDGEVRENTDNISVCEGQKPVVQVDIFGRDKDDTLTEDPVDRNACMDWYNGTYKDYMDEEYKPENGEVVSLSEALAKFRDEYPEAENCDVAEKGNLTRVMIDCVKSFSTSTEDNPLPKLSLLQSSYVFPPVQIPKDQDYVYCNVLAIPISKLYGENLICTEPTPVRIRVERKAPTLLHGLTNIPYPTYIIDVPLRIGLNQLKSVSGVKESASSNTTNLRIPVRSVTKASEKATAMQLVYAKPYIFLVETNDPAYKDLGTYDEEFEMNIGLMAVGEITKLTAQIDGTDNAFEAVLYNDVFTPKEGYYYRLRFNFEENTTDEEVVVCGGQDVFTIKVVSEYQKWNGGATLTDRNWNNDSNWSRVKAEDLYLDKATANRQQELSEFVTDGVDGKTRNDRTFSYAPLDFTKVIIPGISEPVSNPPLLEKYEGEAVVNLSSAYGDIAGGVIWTKQPSTKGAGVATHDIEYDMAAYYAPEGQPSQVRCRPWYSNTCEQIHFRPNSEIGGQGNLIYQKAWVDIETQPGRWYTLATPLKTVVAGDMYLPMANARQETELFTDITFSYGDYNRFAPAVYQRGWNKSTTTVFEIGGGSRNVALKADWSNVYNDVTEVYGGGTGFSIKTDVSGVASPSAEDVLLRLPKADASFDYFSQDGSQHGNTTPIDRTDSYRLNNADGAITSVSRGGNQYFLVGNPFMAHLDMQKFLKANSSKINAKYWVLTGSTQGVAVFDETSDGFVGTESGYAAPMQGFFVEAKDDAAATEGGDSKLELVYTADMACNISFTDSPLRSATRAKEGDIVTISAMREGKVVSQAFINLSPEAAKEYDERNDAVLIDNSELEVPASVYTIGGNRALSVNATDDVDGTEVGLITDAEARTTLVFDGVSALTDVYLYDAVLDRKCSLYDGLEYVIDGPAAGRLFLMGHSDISDSEIQGLSVVVSGSKVRIESGNSMPVAARVYTTDGMLLRDINEGAPVLEFTLDRGIYILEASDSIDSVTRKVFVR